MNSAEVVIKFKGDNKDLNKNIDEAEKKTSKLGSSISRGFKVATVGIMATATAIGKIAVESTKAYAEYEQLLGGVSTLFGTRDAKTVEEYAQLVGKSVNSVRKEFDKLNTAQEIVTVNAAQAYKTAGMSANDYMTTISGFAASLKQSIKDPEKLANAANQAVIDMSDNANKMGTSMEAIQNAYQGFSKQNYTMLDNLKLGYGGTKTEMERLLKDASKISGIKYNIDNLGDVYQAIHVIQTQIGITGTTAKEASSTISGSLNMTKAAYKNLLVALADGEGVDEAFNDLLDSASTFAGNVMPIITQAVESIVNFLPKIIDKVIQTLPGLITTLVPQAINVFMQLIQIIAQALPQLIQAIVQVLPGIITSIAQVLPTLLPTIVQAILDGILAILDNIDLIIDAGIQLLVGLADGIINALPILIEKAPEIISKLVTAIVNNLPKLTYASIEIMKKMAMGLVHAIPQLISKIPQIISSLVNGFINLSQNYRNIGLDIVKGIGKGITNGVGWLKNRIKEFVGNVTSFIKKMFKIGSPSKLMAQQVGQWLPKGIGVGITANTDSVYDAMDEMQEGIMSTYGLSPQMTNSMGMHYSPNVNVYNNVDVSTDPLGQTVSQIKTFSGGAKNDYNYGMGA